ncbi:DNA-directed RNA polymerase [Neptuniibacter sp. QD29_5]|uniref:DNA-directed RNA polymerase n=1 Tax=Neptuniibacter sp. QD29_5 TaxID=3398207 RepID=UPI0039F5430E
MSLRPTDGSTQNAPLAENEQEEDRPSDARCPMNQNVLRTERLNPETFESSIPIALDGSNSGVQHLSLAFRDPIGAAAVNVLPCDRPADIYQMVADKTIATLEEIVESARNDRSGQNSQEDDRPSDAELAQWWLDFGITRKTCPKCAIGGKWTSLTI